MMSAPSNRKSQRERGSGWRYQPLENDSTFSRWTTAEKIVLAKLMKSYHHSWRTRIGKVLPGRSVAAAAGQWKTLKEEAGCPAVADVDGRLKLVSESEAAEHVIRFLGKKPVHRSNRVSRSKEEGNRDVDEEDVYEDEDDDEEEDYEDDDDDDDDDYEEGEEGGGGSHGGQWVGKGRDEQGIRDNAEMQTSRAGKDDGNFRSGPHHSRGPRDSSGTGSEYRSRNVEGQSESPFVQVKLEGPEEDFEPFMRAWAEKHRMTGKRERGALHPRNSDTGLSARMPIKQDDIPCITRKTRSPRLRSGPPNSGWQRSLAILRMGCCVKCGGALRSEQGGRPGEQKMCPADGFPCSGRQKVKISTSHEFEHSSATALSLHVQTPHGPGRRMEPEERAYQQDETQDGESEKQLQHMLSCARNSATWRQRPGQNITMEDQDNKGNPDSGSDSASQLPLPREFDVRPEMFLGKTEEERFKCWQWIISLSLQVLDEQEWLSFMLCIERLQNPSELPWPGIMWLSLSKVLALVQSSARKSGPGEREMLSDEIRRVGEREILADEIRRIIQAAQESNGV